MFERYTEKARRVIFFARYEASNYGSPFITNEHILLGLLREERKIFEILLSDYEKAVRLEDQVRAQQEKIAPKKKIPTSVDLPLDNPAKRTLAYAAEEAERLNDRHIGAEHLLLGLLRESSLASEILTANGIGLDSTREKLRAESRPSPYTIPYTAHGFETAANLHIEFVDAETKVLIALMASPVVVPTIDEEVVFDSRSFRVANVSYVYPEAAELEGFSRKAPRIRVSLELVAETG